MTKILLSLFVLISALTSFASNPTEINYLTDKYMKMINLEGLQIFNVDTGEQLFAYKTKRAENVSKDLTDRLNAETGGRAISRIYELAEESSFQNIYVFVAKVMDSEGSDAQYVLTAVFVNHPDSLFTIDYPISKANLRALTLEAGTAHEPETAEATIPRGTFWPY